MLCTDSAATTALPSPAHSDRSNDASRYVLPWKIRRVKKHKLDHVLMNAAPTSSSRHHYPAPNEDVHQEPRRLTLADFCADSDDDDDDIDEVDQNASSESLDSIVERILENAASDAERHKSSKRKRQGRKMASCEQDWLKENRGTGRLQDSAQPSNQRRLTATNGPTTGDRQTTSSSKHKHSKQHDNIRASVNSQQQQQQLRIEKTLEDLFEEAVESLRDDAEYLSESAATPAHHHRTRSAENWERQIYDSELHDQCRHYRLHAYTSRDTSHVSRGVALVQKLDKKLTPDLEASRKNVQQNGVQMEQPHSRPIASKSGTQSRDDAGDVSYLQRTVISAKASSNDTRQPMTVMDDGIDLGLDMELAANQRQRTSRSSSATWDSVSVDSLVVYDADEATVQAAALYTSSAGSGELDSEFVDKLRHIQHTWQQPATNTGADDDDTDTVWIPISLQTNSHNHRDNISRDMATEDTSLDTQLTAADYVTSDSHQPETDMMMTSPVDADSASILSDSVTSQQVVINIKLPRRSRRQPRRSTRSKQRVPTAPFRELRLRREIRYSDDVVIHNHTSAIVSGADSVPSMTSPHDTDDVKSDRKSKPNDEPLATMEDRVMLSADNLLSGSDLSTLFADAEVEYDDKDSSHTVDLVPVYDSIGRPVTQRVDVSRAETTRVVRLSSTSSSRLVYSTPMLIETVDNIRLALLNGVRGSRDDGVSVSCEAVETVSRRGDQSAPVVRNIVVDCLPSRHSHHHDNHGGSSGENRTLDAV